MEVFDNKKYIVNKILRTGTEGNVYKAQRVSDGVLCAIKEFEVHKMTQEEREDAAKEALHLATVHNENVVSYYDAFVSGDKLYVVMEYCDMTDLGKHIKIRADHQKFFSEEQIWSHFIQMLRGLAALHDKGIIHRNVKSGNVLQFKNNVVKLGDVAVGRLMEGLASQIRNPHYVPPEVWENKPYTFKSDVWALGCVFYELISLTVPFGGCSLPDLRLKVISGLYQPIPSSFSSALSFVLKLLLNPDQVSRMSPRDILSLPILQAHLQHVPPPLLRVRDREEDMMVVPQLVNQSSSRQMETTYPSLAVPGDKQLFQRQALLSNQPALATNYQLSRSKETPVAESKDKSSAHLVSNVGSALTPRVILSSLEDDKIQSKLDMPSRVKVPHVALLGKGTSKAFLEPSIAPSHRVPPSSPSHGLNLKHFKTAYIQPTKIAPDEFPALKTPVTYGRSDGLGKEKLDKYINTLGNLEIETMPVCLEAARRRGEKSTQAGRLLSGSHVGDSICVKASLKGSNSSRTKTAIARETFTDSARSEDVAILARLPISVSEIAHSEIVTRTDSTDSARSAFSSRLDDSVVRAPVTSDELDSAEQPLPHYFESLKIASYYDHAYIYDGHGVIGGQERENEADTPGSSMGSCVVTHVDFSPPREDHLPNLLKYDGVVTEHMEDSSQMVSSEPEPAQGLSQSPAIQQPAISVTGTEKVRGSAVSPMVAMKKPITGHSKVTKQKGNDSLKPSMPVSRHRDERKPSDKCTSKMGSLLDCQNLAKRLPNSGRIKRLSFGGMDPVTDNHIDKKYSDDSAICRRNAPYGAVKPGQILSKATENGGHSVCGKMGEKSQIVGDSPAELTANTLSVQSKSTPRGENSAILLKSTSKTYPKTKSVANLQKPVLETAVPTRELTIKSIPKAALAKRNDLVKPLQSASKPKTWRGT